MGYLLVIFALQATPQSPVQLYSVVPMTTLEECLATNVAPLLVKDKRYLTFCIEDNVRVVDDSKINT